jgi:hypothetical protein
MVLWLGIFAACSTPCLAIDGPAPNNYPHEGPGCQSGAEHAYIIDKAYEEQVAKIIQGLGTALGASERMPGHADPGSKWHAIMLEQQREISMWQGKLDAARRAEAEAVLWMHKCSPNH